MTKVALMADVDIRDSSQAKAVDVYNIYLETYLNYLPPFFAKDEKFLCRHDGQGSGGGHCCYYFKA